MKKALFTLNINDYSPGIRELTYPLLRYHAEKIGAQFFEITERRWPDWPVVYEKMQIYELGRGFDWVLYFDADTLVHPECIDFTAYLPADTCAHNGQDFSGVRFVSDEQDGRAIGTCGWFSIAPASCLGMWKPTDEPLAEIVKHCHPTVGEWNSGVIDRGHLVDDYVMSRNIARQHLKHTTIKELLPKIGLTDADFFWHLYMLPDDEKVRQMRETFWRWHIPHPALVRGWEWLFEK